MYGIGANIRIGREIQCLPYAGFLVKQFVCKALQMFTLQHFVRCVQKLKLKHNVSLRI